MNCIGYLSDAKLLTNSFQEMLLVVHLVPVARRHAIIWASRFDESRLIPSEIGVSHRQRAV